MIQAAHPRCSFRQVLKTISWSQKRSIHACCVLHTAYRNTELEDQSLPGIKTKSYQWEKYNEIVYPPQQDGEPMRPAEICHSRFNIKYSPLKMWYISIMIRGMSIDEALKQLTFYKRKGAETVKEVLLEAQEMAVRDHNVEYKSNLWIADSFVGKGPMVKGMRKHRGPRFGIISYRYCNYFLRLREGHPPKHYYPPPQTGNEKLEEYIEEQRSRRVINSL
ncbi:39S ribosomal protein L22, mitochondrial-like isoform X2 [Gigantopelta aegis]|nr:39S ribosomal protein L22, mitochondrial-like isoform X2 [Gigantopelta aegis]